jgi:hypothetical protein
MHVKIIKRAGHIPRIFENKITKNKFWKEVSEEKGPWESRRIDGKTKCRNMSPHFSIRKTCER